MRARQCGYHQPKPHEIQHRHDFGQPIDYEELHEADEPYGRYPPALPTKPHGARADGWGLEEENNENSVPAVNHIEDKPPKDDTLLSERPKEEAERSRQEEFPEEQLSPDSEEENAESTKGNKGSEGGNTEPEQENTETEQENTETEQENTEPEQGNSEPDQGNTELGQGNMELEQRNLGSDDLILNQLPTGEADGRDKSGDVELASQIEESEVDELGLVKQDPEQETASTGFDLEPESDSDPNTLTEETEGSRAVGSGESMPILT